MKNNKIDFLEEFCFKYLEERGKHFKNNWLNTKGIWNRFLSPSLKQSKTYVETRKQDFEFTLNFIKWLNLYIQEKRLSLEDLNEFVLLLENHKAKISYRFQFLLIFAALILIINGIFKLVNMPTLTYIIIFLFAFFSLNERAFLIDKQAAIEELKNILECFIEKNKS